MANNNELHAKRLKEKAKNLLTRRGGKIHFIGGTALADTSVVGLQNLINTVGNVSGRKELCSAIEDCLRNDKHDWTITYGFIHEVEQGEFLILTDFFHVNCADAYEMDSVANQVLSGEWGNEPQDTLVGQIWVATPKSIAEGEELYIDDLKQWMANCNFFDTEHMKAKLGKTNELVENDVMTQLKYYFNLKPTSTEYTVTKGQSDFNTSSMETIASICSCALKTVIDRLTIDPKGFTVKGWTIAKIGEVV